MDWANFIEEKPGVMAGKPVFKGTRITVEHVLRELDAGTMEKDLLAGHPNLSADHLRAAMLYAAALVDLETTIAA